MRIKKRYKIINELENNSQRATYLAFDEETRKFVVIKDYSFNIGLNWDAIEAIENEVEQLKNLDHPQIPKYIEHFEWQDNYYLVQQYINGVPFNTEKYYSETELVDFAQQLLFTLVYLEKLNPLVIHHDIKPSNILIDSDKKLYLIDFGIAKYESPRTIGITTQFGGTEGFIAPEKFLGRKANCKSDIYSLGIVLACSIACIPAKEALTIIDDNFELKAKFNSNYYSQKFINWVRKLCCFKTEERFSPNLALEKLAQVLPETKDIHSDKAFDSKSFAHTDSTKVNVNLFTQTSATQKSHNSISTFAKKGIENESCDKKIQRESLYLTKNDNTINFYCDNSKNFVPISLQIKNDKTFILNLTTGGGIYPVRGLIDNLDVYMIKEGSDNANSLYCCFDDGRGIYRFGEEIEEEEQELLVLEINDFINQYRC